MDERGEPKSSRCLPRHRLPAETQARVAPRRRRRRVATSSTRWDSREEPKGPGPNPASAPGSLRAPARPHHPSGWPGQSPHQPRCPTPSAAAHQRQLGAGVHHLRRIQGLPFRRVFVFRIIIHSEHLQKSSELLCTRTTRTARAARARYAAVPYTTTTMVQYRYGSTVPYRYWYRTTVLVQYCTVLTYGTSVVLQYLLPVVPR